MCSTQEGQAVGLTAMPSSVGRSWPSQLWNVQMRPSTSARPWMFTGSMQPGPCSTFTVRPQILCSCVIGRISAMMLTSVYLPVYVSVCMCGTSRFQPAPGPGEPADCGHTWRGDAEAVLSSWGDAHSWSRLEEKGRSSSPAGELASEPQLICRYALNNCIFKVLHGFHFDHTEFKTHVLAFTFILCSYSAHTIVVTVLLIVLLSYWRPTWWLDNFVYLVFYSFLFLFPHPFYPYMASLLQAIPSHGFHQFKSNSLEVLQKRIEELQVCLSVSPQLTIQSFPD